MEYLSDLGERCGEEGREKGEKMVVVVVIVEEEAMESRSTSRVGKWHMLVSGTWEEDLGGEEGRECLEYQRLVPGDRVLYIFS